VPRHEASAAVRKTNGMKRMAGTVKLRSNPTQVPNRGNRGREALRQR